MVDEIPAHVIEPIIFSQLPAFLDPSEILKMSERDINAIADESDSRKTQRHKLQSKLDVLTSSSLLCKLYLEKDMPSDAQETPSLHTDIRFSCGKTPSGSIGTSGDNEQCQDVSVISDESFQMIAGRRTLRSRHPMQVLKTLLHLQSKMDGEARRSPRKRRKKEKRRFRGLNRPRRRGPSV